LLLDVDSVARAVALDEQGEFVVGDGVACVYAYLAADIVNI